MFVFTSLHGSLGIMATLFNFHRLSASDFTYISHSIKSYSGTASLLYPGLDASVMLLYTSHVLYDPPYIFALSFQ